MFGSWLEHGGRVELMCHENCMCLIYTPRYFQATTSYTSSRSPRVLSRRLPRRCRPSQQAASFGRFTSRRARRRRPLRRPCARLSCLGARVARGRSRVWICEVDALVLLYAHEMLRASYTFSDSRAFRVPAQSGGCAAGRLALLGRFEITRVRIARVAVSGGDWNAEMLTALRLKPKIFF